MKYTEGMSVCVSVKALYENMSDLTFGHIIPDCEDGVMKYYDLYNEDDELACLDGEECMIDQVGQVLITLRNINGDGTVYFTLTREEADIAIFNIQED